LSHPTPEISQAKNSQAKKFREADITNLETIPINQRIE
jgi:hypothetical protein